MTKFNLRRLTFFCALAFFQTAVAQPTLQKMKDRLPLQKPGAAADVVLSINPKKKTQASVRFSKTTALPPTSTKQWLAKQLQLRPGTDELVSKGKPTLYADMQVEKMGQYFKGIKVEHGTINTASVAGKTTLMEMEFYSIANNFNTKPAIDEQTAFDKALQRIHAKQYVWENDTTQNPLLQKPKAELVIVTDYQKPNDTICLAYKFFINATQPFTSAEVYVHAMDGSIVLVNSLIHSAYGTEGGFANTKYSGRQAIYTDRYSPVFGSPYYRLRQTHNNHDIETYNFGGDEPTDFNKSKHALSPTDFEDADNDWANVDDAATEVHFNMRIISDYWKNIMGRNSYDNNNATITSYVHAKVGGYLAFWEPLFKSMYFGDGEVDGDGHLNVKSLGPDVGLDISAHEMGHAMGRANDMPNLVYVRESGALNEGFSDIWGACIENYAAAQYPSLAGKKSIWQIGEESVMLGGDKGLRDLQNPKKKELPDTYYGTNYVDVSKGGCPDDTQNDHCGVHTNSGIIGKWFSLITAGGTGTNDHGYQYAVAGLGFPITERIAYNTEVILTPNSDYHSVMAASIDYTEAKYGTGSNEAAQVIAAWRAVGVLDTMHFPIAATPEFNGILSGFNCIAVGKDGFVWAGTGREGLYRYNDTSGWAKSTVALDNKLNYLDMKSDQNGGIWIAQSGFSSGTSNPYSSGGIDWFDDTAFSSKRHFAASLDAPPRNTLSNNVRSIWVDTTRHNDTAYKRGKDLPQVWAVSLPNIISGKQTSGGLVAGLNDSIKVFKRCPTCSNEPWDSNFVKVTTGYMDKVDKKTEYRGAQVVGGGENEVWIFSDKNNEKSLISWGYGDNFYNGAPAQIMRFNAKTGDSIGTYNSTNTPIFKENFVAKAIHFDINKNKWVGLLSDGIAMLDKNGKWHNGTEIRSLDSAYPGYPTKTFPDIFPAGTTVSNHAITSDWEGNVYIGTNQGLVVYNGGAITDYHSYKRYTTSDGLPSNLVRGVAVDSQRHGVWLATDMGIALWRQRGPSRLLSVVNINPDNCGRDVEFVLKATGEYFGNGIKNQVIVELSDASGSFTNATTLARFPLEGGGGLNVYKKFTLPTNIPDGNHYMMRASSTNPVVVGSLSRPFTVSKSAVTVPTAGAKTLTASYECTDVSGWTHYYNDNGTPDDTKDDIRLLSLRKGTNNIGDLSDGTFDVKVAATPLAGSSNAQMVNSTLITNPFVSMNRYWDVTATHQPTSPVGVRFYYNSQDLTDINGTINYGPIDHTKLVFYKTNGNPDPTSNFSGATTIISITNGSIPTLTTWEYTQIKATIHQAEFEVAGFSGGGAGSTIDGGPLNDVVTPLHLLSFTGQYANGQTHLQWTTANEDNTSLFEIERGSDGISFAKINHKMAVGTGNNSYSTTDIAPAAGLYYYRLKMVDKNGEYKYSSIVKLAITEAASFVIRPNPAHHWFQMVGVSNSQKIQMSDISARVIKIFAPQTSNRYNVAGIAPGVYMVSVVLEKQVFTQKIVIQ